MSPALTPESWQGTELPRTQEKLLRAYAPRLVWYLQPPQNGHVTLQDFLGHTHGRLHELLGLKEFRTRDFKNERPDIGTDFSSQRHVMRHLTYNVLQNSTYAFTHGLTPQEVGANIKRGLQVGVMKGALHVEHPHHPLYNVHGRVEFTQDDMSKCFPLKNVADRRFVGWLAQRDWPSIAEQMPEITEFSRDVTVTHHASDIRLKLRNLLWDSIEPPPRGMRISPDLQDAAVVTLADAWEQLPDTLDNLDRAMEAERVLNMKGILRENPAKIVERIPKTIIATPKEEETWAPLLQQLILTLSIDRKTEEAAQLASLWGERMMRFGIAPCDRPTQSLAILSGMVSDSDSTIDRILDRI